MKKAFKSAYLALVLLFLYAPIAVMIALSFNASKSRAVWGGFSLTWYAQLFDSPEIMQALQVTLTVAVLATLVATVIGSLGAIGIHAMKSGRANALINLSYLSMTTPDIATGVSLMLLFVFIRDRMGIPLEMGFLTLILAHITFSIPYVILNVIPKLRQMDKNIYDAALDLGCNPAMAFLKGVIPEIMPGVISGFLMSFTFSLDDFIISYFVSGPTFSTLPITIYAMTRKKVSPEINALSTIVFLVVLGVLALSNYMEAKREAKTSY